MNMLIFLVSAFATTLKGQTFELMPISVEIGSSFTMNCITTIDGAIDFRLEGNLMGSCPVPFGVPLPCNPVEISQDVPSTNTSWTITSATSNHNGTWNCRKGSVDSNELQLYIFQCANSATGTGITSDLVLNGSSTVNVNVDIDCLFSSNTPTIQMIFQRASGANISVVLTCSTASTTCSTGLSAYQCTLEISKSLPLTINIEYSLNVEIIPTGALCESFALFSPYTVKISSEGPEITTKESISTELSTIARSSINADSSNYTTSWSGKGLTETVSIISTDNHITTKFTASDGTDQLSVIALLVISISVVCFCLVIISVVTICVVYHKRNSNGQKKSVTNFNHSQPFNERCNHQTQGIRVPKWRDAKDRNSNFQHRPKHNSEISSYNYSHSTRNERQQRGRHTNNNYSVSNGTNGRGLAFAYYRNTHYDLSRQRQMSIPNEYTVYNGHNRRGVINFQEPYYSCQNNSIY